AVALAGGLKLKDGSVFSLQMQGKGPVHTLITDITSTGNLRGCAKFDADALAAELARVKPGGFLPHLVGTGGHLAFTVDQGPDTERFQGIVELSGETLTDAIHHYFRQSEQLESAIKISVRPPTTDNPRWTAGAVLIQRMPAQGGQAPSALDDLDD